MLSSTTKKSIKSSRNIYGSRIRKCSRFFFSARIDYFRRDRLLCESILPAAAPRTRVQLFTVLYVYPYIRGHKRYDRVSGRKKYVEIYIHCGLTCGSRASDNTTLKCEERPFKHSRGVGLAAHLSSTSRATSNCSSVHPLEMQKKKKSA